MLELIRWPKVGEVGYPVRIVGREVSCIALSVIFAAAEKRGIALECLAEGVPYSLAHMRRRRSWIDWTAFAQLSRNMEAIWSADELFEIGREALRVPTVRWIAAVGRYLTSVQDFYVMLASV